MTKTTKWTTYVLTLGLLTASSATAAIISVSGPTSSAGTLPEIIPAPANVLEDDPTNTGMQGFDEAQGVVLSQDYDTDLGSIGQGTRVDSHMIFLNSVGDAQLTHQDVVWTFDGLIIGIMSDQGGLLEAASSDELGAPGTNYTTPFPGSGPAAPFTYRGLESNFDMYQISGNQLTIRMLVTEPGDWVRVITAPPPGEEVPEPGTVALFGAGLFGFAWLRRKRKA